MRGAVRQRPFGSPAADLGDRQQVDTVILAVDHEGQVFMDRDVAVAGHGSALLAHQNSAHSSPPAFGPAARAGRASSEERRVGKGCISTCTARWSPYH